MAIIVAGMKCSLCDAVLGGGADLVATSAFISDRTHHLWRFSDAAMHRTCFLSWKYRHEFVDLYNGTVGTIVWGNGTRQRMQPNGSITSERVEL